MRRISLSQRVVLGSLCLSLFVVALVGLTLRRLSDLSAATSHLRIADDVLVMGTQIQDDLFELLQAQEYFDQYLSEQAWQHYTGFSKRVGALLDRARDLRSFRKQGRELDALDDARLHLETILQNASYTINPNFPVGAVASGTLERIRASRADVHRRIRAVMLHERNNRKLLENLLKQQVDEMATTMAWVVGAVLAAGIGFAYYLHRAAMNPLRELMEVMRRTGEPGPLQAPTPTGAPEMRELIESFNQMQLTLSLQQKKLASMFSLAVMVAHEVRNPIAAIGTAVQALSKDYPADGRDSAIFPEIQKEIYRINTIISDLLVFARPRPLAAETMSMVEMIGSLRVLMQAALAEKAITFTTDLSPDADPLVADPDQMHRVLLNLLTNAIDAAGAGGTIRVVLQPDGPRAVVLTVEDSGPGIPEADREKIFDPFFSTKVKGTGLGLAIVSDIIQRHGGQIRAEGAGRALTGARFVITLPRHPPAMPAVNVEPASIQ